MNTIEKTLNAITKRLQEKTSAGEFNFLTKLKNEILFDLQKQNEVKEISSNVPVSGQLHSSRTYCTHFHVGHDGKWRCKDCNRLY